MAVNRRARKQRPHIGTPDKTSTQTRTDHTGTGGTTGTKTTEHTSRVAEQQRRRYGRNTAATMSYDQYGDTDHDASDQQLQSFYSTGHGPAEHYTRVTAGGHGQEEQGEPSE